MRIDYQTWQDVIVDIEQYIPKLLQACDSISELLYEEMNEEKWNIFGQLLEGLENLYQVLIVTLEDTLDHAPSLYSRLTPTVERFPQHFLLLQNELQAGNYVGVGDIVRYEWPELLDAIMKVLKEKD